MPTYASPSTPAPCPASAGLSTYFVLLKRLTKLFFFMFLIALPTLWMCHSGTGLEDMGIENDALAAFTLANFGSGKQVLPPGIDINTCFNTSDCAPPTADLGPIGKATIFGPAIAIGVLDALYR